MFLTSKGENIAFPPPSPPCNVVPLFELPVDTPSLNGGDRGGVWILLVSEVTVFEYNICLNNFVADFILERCPRLES